MVGWKLNMCTQNVLQTWRLMELPYKYISIT